MRDNNEIEQWFDSHFSVSKPKIPCIILFKGQQVRLVNGKQALVNERSAKLAMSNALYGLGNRFGFKSPKEFREYLEKEKIIEYKTFNIDE